MAASARVAYLARRASDYGVHTGPVKVNLAQVRERKQKVVERFRNGAEQILEATANLDVIRGEASFIDARTVKAEGAGSEALRLSAEKIFINTGAKPVIPPIDGLSRVPSLDSTSIMELDELPKHLLIVGGGYIAIEFGQMFSGDGGEATVKGSHLLIAAGRRPSVDHLNLGAAGVEMDEKGYVKANERLETNVPGIY